MSNIQNLHKAVTAGFSAAKEKIKPNIPEENILGEFKYHRFVIKLKASKDETTFTVERQENKVKQTYTFTDLGSANDKFLDMVRNAIYYTSFTDVSIWMQQHSRYY